ncbi:PH domain-like protein [Sodiomyces alkalinus F11]|uniref:PH domain-like protein n=1 Tax=Sodiomyces alkalinus (strain CBS 110278 / VKM F-3762 / F11) TaxID=1314773 RepID=A0A3N2QA98_SODAK|nr:PH domain-like protein [Sodiomyces alkalinus F11]ROT43671.1 PH domain-like protein [Sodiomyces alkalinus F11]
MVGPTPRKRTHGRQPSNSHRHGQASDYDSDAAHQQLLLDNQQSQLPPPNPALINRTNTELNLSVLQRYLPSIHTILSIAANAVVYSFNSSTSSWDRAGIEGTYFLCLLQPDPAAAAKPGACLFVLNRRGLENKILDLSRVAHFEVMDEIYIFNMEPEPESPSDAHHPVQVASGSGGDQTSDDGSRVVGVWIHADDKETRMTNAAMVQEAIRSVRAGHGEEDDVEEPGVPNYPQQERPVQAAEAPSRTTGGTVGQRLNVDDLFLASRNGAGG